MEKKNTNENRSITTFKSDFEAIYGIIASHRDRVVKQVNGESVMMVWEVGEFVSGKLKTSAWGSGVVRQLAEYIHTQDPTVRGWSYRTIYKMVQFYETYSSPAFIELIGKVKSQQIVPFEMAQIPNSQIVPIQSAQIQPHPIVPIGLAQIPTILFSTGWSNHQIIMNYCKTDEQRLFYMLYAGRERLEYKELERAIKTDTMFYLDALDQEERRSNENPSIGILLCKEANLEVVRFALNRSMSPTMVAQYKEQLQVGGVIQRSLVEFCKLLDYGGKKNE